MQSAEISIRHSCRCRTRFSVNALHRSDALKQHIKSALSADDCVSDFSINTLTGSVLVFYDHGSTHTTVSMILERIVAEYQQSLAKAAPVRVDNNMPVTRGNGKKNRTNGKTRIALSAASPIDTSSRRAENDALQWHTIEAEEAVSRLKTSIMRGLGADEALERYALYGPNELSDTPSRSRIAMMLEQLNSLPVYLLGATAIISAATGGLADAAIICAVMGINAVIGYFTESHSERAIESLKNTYKPDACVIRCGSPRHINPREVVIGDLLVLKPGVYVTADCRIVDAHHLSVDESPLTGESLPVSKFVAAIGRSDVPLAERHNMVFTGTMITGGQGLAVVTATGEHTELGVIQRFIDNTVARETPLEKELDIVGRRIVMVCVGVCGLVFAVGLLRGQTVIAMLRSALSLAIAAVPEGLPAVATTTLAFGVTAMRSKKVLIRRLKAIEMLGACRIVCFDKTGTITRNKMTVASIHSGGTTTELSGGKFITDIGHALLYDEFEKLLSICVLCSEVDIREEPERIVLLGSSTEKALVNTAINAGCDIIALRAEWPVEKLIHRNEKHNYMASFHRPLENGNGRPGGRSCFERDGGCLVTVKGNPAEVLARCGSIAQNGVVRPMEDSDKEAALNENGRMADRALRVLGVAYGYTVNSDDRPENLTWVGLIGMTDPVKEGVRELLTKFHAAGIRTVMITGDQTKTARAVADQIGIGGGGEIGILDSSALTSLSDEELKDVIGDVAVFSRVSPVHKYRIVRLLQDDGSIVAMTGDGINDGPALKAADIGIAMGKSGTELAREVADVILETDDLDALFAAVKHGRTTYVNVKKSIRFLLSTNFSEIMVTFVALTAGLGHPLNIMQLLWINLITDIFPALALALEPPEPDIMQRLPRASNAQLVDNKDMLKMLRESSVISAGGLAAYGYGLSRYGASPQAGTMAFMGLGLAQLLHSVSCRSENSSIFDAEKRPANKYLNVAVGGSIALQLLCPFIPGLKGLLGLAPINLIDGLVIGASAALPLIINETLKKADDSLVVSTRPLLV